MDLVFAAARLSDVASIGEKVTAAVATGDLFEGPNYDNSE